MTEETFAQGILVGLWGAGLIFFTHLVCPRNYFQLHPL